LRGWACAVLPARQQLPVGAVETKKPRFWLKARLPGAGMLGPQHLRFLSMALL
jgi:hypothetical protein